MFGFGPIATILFILLFVALYLPIRRVSTRLIAVLSSLGTTILVMFLISFLTRGVVFYALILFIVGTLLSITYELWRRYRG